MANRSTISLHNTLFRQGCLSGANSIWIKGCFVNVQSNWRTHVFRIRCRQDYANVAHHTHELMHSRLSNAAIAESMWYMQMAHHACLDTSSQVINIHVHQVTLKEQVITIMVTALRHNFEHACCASITSALKRSHNVPHDMHQW